MSAVFELRPCGPNCWQMQGRLNFSTVPQAWQRLKPVLLVPGQMQVSLSGVEESNSAALALLLEAKEIAAQADCVLSFTDIPQDLLSLARMSNCAHLLV